MRPPITQRCPKTTCFPLKTNIQKSEFYFGGLDLQCRRIEIGFLSCKIEKDNFRDSQGKLLEQKTRNLLNLGF